MTRRDQRKARAQRRSQAKHAERMAAVGQPVRVQAPATSIAKPARRVCGLEWLITRKPARLSREQYEAGKRYGEICSEALRAQLPSKGSLVSGFGSRMDFTPSAGTFRATRERLAADRKIVAALGPDDGRALIALLEQVCHHGSTIRDIACGDKLETLRLEERLKLGLSILRTYARQQRAGENAEAMA